MKQDSLNVARLVAVGAALLVCWPAAASPAPSVDEQVRGMQQACADSAGAREARHAATPLFQRLGGYDRVLTLTREIVRLHGKNDSIRHYFAGVDAEALARHVADFVAAGTGGEQRYTGRDMVSAHAHMKLTDADFLSAGGDVVAAMQSLGHGADEIDEVVCILVSLKDEVVQR